MVAKETANRRKARVPRPLDTVRLEELALAYVARFATSSSKLASYLNRKIRERGFEGEQPFDIAALVERYCDLGYVDDAAYARARSGDLSRRGYGPRRIEQALRAAGIDEQIRDESRGTELAAREAAMRLAQRRRFGPFGEPVDRQQREKQIAAMVRAGHTFDAARALVEAVDMASAQDWVAEAEGIE